MNRLSNVAAIVTGAGSGLGQATALYFAEEGARVLCADIDSEVAEATAGQISHSGAIACTVDVRSRSATESMARQAIDAFGRIDVLVANAGMNVPGRAHEIDEDSWSKVIATNLTGVWLCARAVLPWMLAQESGVILSTASVAGLIGDTCDAAYSAAKGGVIALTRQMAADYGPSGIRVNTVCPGLVPTPFARRVVQERAHIDESEVAARLESAADRFPLKRLGLPNDVANLLVFLASDEASWISGVALPVDGGLSAVARIKT